MVAQGETRRGSAFRLTWQVWFQSDLNFSASIQQLWQGEIAGDISVTHPGIFYFHFIASQDVQYEITTKSKLSISFPGEFIDYKKHLDRVKPFLVRPDLAPATKFEIYKRLKDGKIFKIEDIEKIKHRIQEADYEDVLANLKVLEKEEDPDVLLFRLENLDRLARSKRIGHLPEVLPFLEKALNDPKYQPRKVLAKLIRVPSAILGIEIYYKMEKHQQVVDKIQESLLNPIIEIADKGSDQEVLLSVTYFLKLTDRNDSVKALFRMVLRMDDELYNNLRGFVKEALFREDSVLKQRQSNFINEKIDELLKSKDQKIRKRVKELC